jgi:hypothetical protein
LAKLPGAPDLGPAPGVGPRPVATLDVSGFARGAQALAEGVRTAGAGVAKVGEGVGEYTLDRNRWDDAKARANFTTGAIDVSEDLAKDQNYSTDASGNAMPKRYGDRYRELQTSSAELIADPRMRERFMMQTAPLVEQHVKRAEDHARGLENNASVAYVEQQGDNIINKAVATTDDATRTQLINAHTQLIDGLVAKGAKTQTEGLAMKQAWAHQYAAADGLAAVNSGDPARIEGAVNRLRQAPGTPDDITARILEVEGESRNPRSSAVGAGQFTNATWLDMIRRHRPDLAQGRSDAEILSLRADRGLGRDMTEAYRSDNERYLRNKGIDATPGAQYLAHFLGPAGATAVLQANPGQSVEAALATAVGPDKARGMVAANPEVLRGQLAGSVSKWADSKMGGSGGQSGHIYDILRPEVREQLIARGEASLHKVRVNDRVAFETSIADDLAAAGRAGALPAAGKTAEDFIREYGYGDGEKRFKTYGDELQLGIDAHAMAGMSSEDRAAMIERYTPEPGEGYAAAAKRQDALVAVDKSIEASHAATEKRVNALADAADKLTKERDQDPAAYAIKYMPGVSDSWGKLQDARNSGPLNPALDPAAAARDYAATTLFEQRRLGVAPDAITIAPKSYLDGFTKAITAAADSDDATKRTALIGQVQREAAMWGDNWPTVMRQMAPTAQPIVRAIAAGADPVAMTRLLSLGKDENPGKLLKEQNETKFKDVTTALNTEMAPFLGSLVGRQRDRDFGAYYGLGEKLASLYVRDGDDASTAAHKAFNALVGNRYEFRDTWRMPKSAGVSADDVQAGVEDAKLAVRNGTLNIRPAINDIGVADNRADSFSKFARDGRWVTSADQSGLNLVYDDRFVKTQDGKPLLLTWADLATRGTGYRGDVAAGAAAATAGP